MSVSAPPRSRRYSDDDDDDDDKYYYDEDSLSHSSPRRKPRDDKHENCRDGSCEAIEKEYGGFGWGEGITLAVIGAMALFNFDKAYEKHKAKSERKEREEKEATKREKERRHSVGGGGGGRDRDRHRDVDRRGERRRESLPRDAYYPQGRDGYRPRGSWRDEERTRRKERYLAGDDPYQRHQSYPDRYY